MTMALEKAKVMVGKWRNNGYKAGKTLREMGYSESMALKKPMVPINSALRVVARNEMETIIKSDNPAGTLLGLVGMNQDDLLGHYRYIIKQDKDLSIKLKALMPLLSTMGIRWNDNAPKVEVPILNVTVSKTENTSE